MKYLINYRSTVFELIILSAFFVCCLFSMDVNAECFEAFVRNFFDIRDTYEMTDKGKIIFQTTPVIVFFFFNGTYLYKKWNIDNIYTLVRYKKRISYYIKNTIYIISISVLMSLLFMVFLYAVYKHNNENDHIDIHYLASLWLYMMVVYYFMAMIFSLISIKFGSLYGCFGSFLIWTALVILSLYISYKCNDPLIICILKSFVPGVSLFCCIVNEDHGYFMDLVSILQIFVICILSGIIVKKTDIGLSDKEAD